MTVTLEAICQAAWRIPTYIVMPDNAPAVKKAALQGYN